MILLTRIIIFSMLTLMIEARCFCLLYKLFGTPEIPKPTESDFPITTSPHPMTTRINDYTGITTEPPVNGLVPTKDTSDPANTESPMMETSMTGAISPSPLTSESSANTTSKGNVSSTFAFVPTTMPEGIDSSATTLDDLEVIIKECSPFNDTIEPALNLSWCVDTNHTVHFRHFISCNTSGTFMGDLGLERGDEIVVYGISFTNRLTNEELLYALEHIQLNETFELIYRSELFPRVLYTYTRAQFISSTNPVSRRKRVIEISFKVKIFDKIAFPPGIRLPPIKTVIGTSSDNFICNTDPISSCNTKQVFEFSQLHNFISRTVHARFRVPGTRLYIKALNETNVEIRQSFLSTDRSTLFEAIVVSKRLQFFTIRNILYPDSFLFESNNFINTSGEVSNFIQMYRPSQFCITTCPSKVCPNDLNDEELFRLWHQE